MVAWMEEKGENAGDGTEYCYVWMPSLVPSFVLNLGCADHENHVVSRASS